VLAAPINAFLAGLDAAADLPPPNLSAPPPQAGELRALVADSCAVRVLSVEREARNWVFATPARVRAIARVALRIVRAFLADNAASVSAPSSPSVYADCRALLDLGVISALKVLQDLCSLAFTPPATASAPTLENMFTVLTDVIALNWAVLRVDSLPRRCITAAAIGLVTATVCLEGPPSAECDAATAESAADHVECAVIYPARDMSAFVQLSLLRALVESPTLLPIRANLLLGVKSSNDSPSTSLTLLNRLCALCTGNADMQVRMLCGSLPHIETQVIHRLCLV
jgi:hypothetical protein